MKRGWLRNNQIVWRFLFSVFFALTAVAADRSALAQTGLQVGWQSNLPLKQAESVERMYVFGKYLYVLTDQNYLFCVDREKGDMRFCLQLVKAGLKVQEPQYYDGKLLFTVGNRFLILDPVAGMVTDSRQFDAVGGVVVCPAVRNCRHIFVAGLDKRLHAMVADEYWQEFMVTADNDSLINSLVVDDEFVFFSTEVGNVVKTSSQKAKRLWQRDIPGKISAPITRDGRWLYVGSINMKLYKLDINTGQSGWVAAFQAGAELTNSAVVGRKAIYQYAGENGLYAIDKVNGKELWQVKGAVGLLAEKGSTAYVFARPSALVVMDNDTGEKRYSVNLAGVWAYAVNITDSTIYVSDDRGRTMGIEAKVQR
jgi:outer membrane protein assembly factor BamB